MEVKDALHVDINIHWTLCSKHFNYHKNSAGSLPNLLHLIGKYNILFYSGDADSVVPFTNTFECS